MEDHHTWALAKPSFLWRTATQSFSFGLNLSYAGPQHFGFGLNLSYAEPQHFGFGLNLSYAEPQHFGFGLWRTATLLGFPKIFHMQDHHTSDLAKSFFQRTTTLQLRLNLLDGGLPILSWLHCRIGEKENQ
jgi:hypothetical protein